MKASAQGNDNRPSSSFVWGSTFLGLPASGPHRHLQGEVWANHHPSSSKGMSRQCRTLSGSWPQEHRYHESVRRHLFLQVQQWPSCVVRHNVQLSTRPSTAVPQRPLHTSFQCLSTVASSICHFALFWWFRDAGSAHSVHGPSLWPARRFWTLYQTAWEIRSLTGTASNVCWRHIYLHCTESFSVLEMFRDDTLYKLTYLTY